MLLKEKVKGSRGFNSFLLVTILFTLGISFCCVGLWSARSVRENFTEIVLNNPTKMDELLFLPQGFLMLFYGSLFIGLGIFASLINFYDLGGGYNEFLPAEKRIRFIRFGFPGKNRVLFFSYELKSVTALKLVTKKKTNGTEVSVLLSLCDGREIPLFSSKNNSDVSRVETKAISCARHWNLQVEHVLK